MLLTINGADKTSGNFSDFFINCNPPVDDISSIELVYMTIPSHAGYVPLYFVEIQGFNNPVISTLKNGSGRFTFVVPNDGNKANAVFHTNSHFIQQFQQIPTVSLSNLRISIFNENGVLVTLTSDVQLILRIN